MSEFQLLVKPLLAAVFGSIACGIVGVWVVLLNIPFVGVAMSHAAFAGAVCGLLLGINPLLTGLLFAGGAALLIGPVAERADLEPGVSLGVIFSLMLGLAFLGIGLLKGPRTEALRFIWGNILLVSRTDLILLGLNTLVVIMFLLVLNKETRAVLFHRELARAVGVPERTIFFSLLVLCALTVTANLNTIGGLLIFSLVVSPASAAYQLTYRLNTMYLLSSGFALLASLSGLALSWFFNLPSGAAIICSASLIFTFALIFSPKRRMRPRG
ncbi:MAG: metal ABC transporter permease [candidate division WOR-3 bacterium]